MPKKDFEFRNVNGHIEVYLDNEFILSADTKSEAYEELSRIIVLR